MKSVTRSPKSAAFSLLAAIAVFLALPLVASAQGQGAQASVEATASVIAQLDAVGQADLSFGDVIPGVSRTVVPSSPDAGRFRVQGGGEAEIEISFDLPTGGVLEHASTAATLPIVFGAGAAGYGPNAGSVIGAFDPSGAVTQNLQSGELFVFIGGQVNPATTQEAGDYAGEITLNVAYTGN